ncbi:hypothetical protein BH09BAC4_BH09BAC4_15470 [soil metagenome]
MIWNNYPEVKLAQLVLKKHSISLPVKIHSLLELYATVIFESIPIAGVDGIAINIKVPGKIPIVIVNKDAIHTRQRFTMAHELGHLIIPWHTGIKIDNGESNITSDVSYSELEVEANRFAAELLMPSDYIRSIATQNDNLAKAQKEICKRLNVSPRAAATQIGNSFPAGVIYCAVEKGIVIYSGKTKGTSAKIPPRGQIIDEDLYPSSIKKSVFKFNDITYYWWEMIPHLSTDMSQSSPDWRQLLDEIVSFKESEQDREKYKKSVNGIIAHVNGRKRNEADYSLESLLAACYERFNRDEYSQMRSHHLFDGFLRLRLGEFIERAKGYDKT